MSQDKYIVTTTINKPTKALKIFDQMPEWQLIAVGDLKTPSDFKLENGLYLNPSDQEKLSIELSDAIGWNCIQRRNFGFLEALKRGAKIIATVDDDNIPLDSWGKNIDIDKQIVVKQFLTDEFCFDPIGSTNYPQLWHRGFPLQLLSKRNYSESESVLITPSVQADFWNGDPDIDAICRMEHSPECDFDPHFFPFTSNRLSPFNSQNTFLSVSIFPDYFLFPHVGRMDDIWASYYVQSKNHKVIYKAPSVFQDRNQHDLIKDMKLEYLGYENNLKILEKITSDPDAILEFLPERTKVAWKIFRKLLS